MSIRLKSFVEGALCAAVLIAVLAMVNAVVPPALKLW